MNNVKKFNLTDKELLYEYQRVKDVNIPKIQRIIQRGEKLEVTFEYINGIDLSEYKYHSVEELIEDFYQILNIVKELHKHNIIHRDIKPSNIIKSSHGKIYLIDFGIARFYTKDKNRDTTLFGTEAYAAPEQFGFMQSDYRTCIYQIGITFKELNLQFNHKPFNEILNKCSSFDPNDRYQKIEDIPKKIENKSSKVPRNILIVYLLIVFFTGTSIVCEDMLQGNFEDAMYGIGVYVVMFLVPLVGYLKYDGKKTVAKQFLVYFGWFWLFGISAMGAIEAGLYLLVGMLNIFK